MQGLGFGAPLTKLRPWYQGQLGVAGSESPLGARLLPESVLYYVAPDCPTASDSNDGTDPMYPMVTIPAAFAKCVAGQHDTVVYVSGTTGASLSAQLLWNKSYTHLVGVAAPTMIGQRARISQAAGDLNLSPLIDVTADGCLFENLYIFQGPTDPHSLINVRVTGQRNAFNNVHFAGGGGTNNVDGCASLAIVGGDENLFTNCTVGLDTADAGAGEVALLFGAVNGASRNVFRDCHFTLHAGNADAAFVECPAAVGMDRYTIFERCLFTNLALQQMTSAFVVAADFGPPVGNKRVILFDCQLLGAPDWETGDRGLLAQNVYPAAGGGLTGLLQTAAVA